MADNSRKYPLIEVITEFHLPPAVWRDDLPDLLYEKLKGELPGRITVETVKKLKEEIELAVSSEQHEARRRIIKSFNVKICKCKNQGAKRVIRRSALPGVHFVGGPKGSCSNVYYLRITDATC